MVKTLEEAQRLQKNIDDIVKEGGRAPYRVTIQREVRYYASVGNTMFELHHDWTVEQLDKRLWMRDMKKPKKVRKRVRAKNQ